MEPEYAWMAGLLEGEGWFGQDQRGRPCIEVEMTDLDVIQRLADMWGITYIYRRQRRLDQTIYRVKVRGDRAAKVMREILPYMGERRTSRIHLLLG